MEKRINKNIDMPRDPKTNKFAVKHNPVSVGDRFNKWIVLNELSERKRGAIVYICQCDCGYIKKGVIGDIKNGKSKQCINCFKKIMAVGFTHTHRKRNSRSYMTWSCIKQRCTNKNNKDYETYAGRGITMCDRWLHSFENFYQDMGERQKGMQIDRIDNSGNYEPGNCRWVTPKQNAENRRRSGPKKKII